MDFLLFLGFCFDGGAKEREIVNEGVDVFVAFRSCWQAARDVEADDGDFTGELWETTRGSRPSLRRREAQSPSEEGGTGSRCPCWPGSLETPQGSVERAEVPDQSMLRTETLP